MPGLAAAERTALADLLDRLGPDAPTLCDGWTTRDLAAHVVLRDRVPAAWPGILASRFADRTGRAAAGLTGARTYPELVALIRAGAPAWSPLGAPGLRGPVNLMEFLVHHEDVRRAQPGWGPRAVPTELADAVWTQLRLLARPLYRRVPDGVVLARTGVSGGRIVGRRGRLVVTVAGDPVEVALYSYGRRAAARVEISGDDAAVARLAATPLSI